MTSPRQNFICNFRAPDREQYQIWLDFKESAQDCGLDVCYLILSLCKAWLESFKETKTTQQIITSTQIINLQQQNTFYYGVEKPRRIPTELFCTRKMPFRTFWSRCIQAYMMEKARELQRSFSHKDFAELDYDFFRKHICVLRKCEKICALEPRTNPRFYILSEWKGHYPAISENNRVKPKFTEGDS